MSLPTFNLIKPDSNKISGQLQLSPITINEDYRKKWNIHEHDYVCLTKGGELISNALYRVGGFGGDITKKYFMLLKYVEAFYSDSITTDKKRKPHLEGRWCILDNDGVEKKEFDHFKTPHIEKDSCIYSVEQKYYNIETGEFYCRSSSSISSGNYLFLENAYDDDKSKRGVMKINKKDGTWELFP